MPDKILKKNLNTPVPDDAALFGRIVDILEEARSHVARTVNSAMVVAYWLIGREIVEEEQKGQKRADYGKAVIEDLSRRLTGRYGKGYSTVSLWNMRKFYQTYISRSAAILSPSGREFRQQKILSPVGRELGKSGNPHPPGGELTPKQHPTGVESATGFHPDLSWSHYRTLMRVENEKDFVYSDVWKVDKETYWEHIGVTVDGVKIDTNTKADGRFHSNWLNMLYPRLLEPELI